MPAAIEADPNRQESVQRNQFGTFGGVFTPAILTILGVIMFMLAGKVIGHAGIFQALLILLICKAITFFTGLSISAVSTNTRVKGGGAYFLISRALGPELGGAIGLTLYLAQALSIPFYVLGFTQALVLTFPSLGAYFTEIAFIATAVLFVIAYVGASWAIRIQYFVLAILACSIVAFMGGAIGEFSAERFYDNLTPVVDHIEPQTFWMLFALYFPAVTGIMAGVNMSGDLKDPARSLPRGTLAAVAVGLLVYGVQIILCGGALDREAMIDRPYGSLIDLAFGGLGFLVIAGVFAATISSAIGSLVGAPRVLQALARDDLLTPLRFFSTGSKKGDEPRRALLLSLAITVGVLLWAGSGEEGSGGLEQVAAVVTMFFLATYGATNLAAFVEAAGGNPSFRPRFRFFHWSAALIGGVGCVAAAVLVDAMAAGAATVIILGLWYYVARKDLTATFGDARRGFVYTRLRNSLFKLDAMPHDAKNWRPTVLVLTSDPEGRLNNVNWGLSLEAGRGVVTLAHLMIGDIRELAEVRREALVRYRKLLLDNNLPAFVEVAVVPDFDDGLRILLQTHSLGPLKPNIVLFGWAVNAERVSAFLDHLHCTADIGMSMVLLRDRGFPSELGEKRIDVWWRGEKNGSLMLLLAHLLASNQAWSRTTIRILRVVRNEVDVAPAELELIHLIEAGRIEAEARVLHSEDRFVEVLHKASSDASVIFLGFNLLPRDLDSVFHRTYGDLTEGLPTTILVHSAGDVELRA